MLTNYPETSGPPQSPVAPRQSRGLMFLAIFIYHVTISVAGALAGVVVSLSDLAWRLWCKSQGFPNREGGWDDPLDDLVGTAIAGAVVGLLCGQIFWIVASLWPRARRPMYASVICSSISGTISGIMLVQDGVFTHPPLIAFELFRLGGSLAAGSVFGFVTTWLTLFIERAFGWMFPHSPEASG